MLLTTLFTLLGFIIILGFSSNYLFEKTGIPDILILLLLGIFLGPVFHIIDPTNLREFSSITASIALMIILFEGGLNLNIYKVFKESSKAALLALVSTITSIIITIFFTRYFLGWGLFPGVLLGVMASDISSSIVIPLISRIKAKEEIKALLSLESAFTDSLTVVIGIALIEYLRYPTNNTLYSVAHGIASAFSIGTVLGLIIGLTWLKILKSLEKEHYKNILTLAIVFMAYSLVESLGGNGAISSLMFGLVIGNGKIISHILKQKKEMKPGKYMKEFHSEISFLVRTFFFVYLGMIVIFSNIYIVIVSVLLSLFLVIGRLISVYLTSIGDKTLIENRGLMTMMLPRGLAAAVLSQLPLAYGMKNASLYPKIILTLIASTVIISSIGLSILRKRENEWKK